LVATNPERSTHFPAIEQKYDQPMSYWFDQMIEIADRKYPEQIIYPRKNYGFMQVHANALVMHARGSTTSHMYDNVNEYLGQFYTAKQDTVLAIFTAMTDKYPQMDVVIAWNHPFGEIGDRYIMGVSVHQKHILLGPTRTEVLAEFAFELSPYVVNKKTFRVPVDWIVDSQLLKEIVERTLHS